MGNWFKVITWSYALKGSGFDICCVKHGLSVNMWHKTKEAAWFTIEQGKVPLICPDCKVDMERIFE